MPKPVRVLLADDHWLLLDGLEATLGLHDHITVVGRAMTGDETLQLCYLLNPDILLLDLIMPGLPATEVVTKLRSQADAPKVLVLTAHCDDECVQSLISVGVEGYLLKEESVQVLCDAISAVMQGHRWYSQPVLNKLVAYQELSSQSSLGQSFTPREHEVLRCLKQGWKNVQIADRLAIKPRTVRYHLHNIYNKLGVETHREAIVRIISLDLD